MNKNSIIGMLLIAAIMFGMFYLNKPSEEEIARNKHIQDSTINALRIQDSIAKLADAQVEEESQIADTENTDVISSDVDSIEQLISALQDSLNTKKKLEDYGVFSKAAKGESKDYVLENDLMKVKINSKGGIVSFVQLKKYQTFDTLPLILVNKKTSTFGFTFNTYNRRTITTDSMFFVPISLNSAYADKDSFVVSGKDSLSFAMRLYPNSSDGNFESNSYIEYVYTLKGDDYMIGFDINFVGLNDIIASNTTYLSLNWKAELIKQEKAKSKYNGPTVYYKYYEDDVDYLSETKDDEEKLVSKIKWVSFKQQFFSSTLIADNSFNAADVKVTTNEERKDEHYLRDMSAQFEIPFNPNVDQSFPMTYYFGPNKYKRLRSYDLDLEQQIPLGWSFFLMHWINRFIVIPVFNFLEGHIASYGLIILILTLMLKLVLFPIAYKTYVSSAKMRVLKPEIDEIAAKFPKKEDSVKKQQATMAFYKKAGVNPMAGCVPMLLQFPFLIAMFRFFPAAFELRQQSFLWATDLSSYDSIWTFPNGFSIPFYGDHISLFTLLMTVSTIFYTRINNQMMASSQQMPGMKVMMYMMPIMFLGIFNNYAAGLSYYYFLANIITFGQMFLIKRFIDEDALRLKLQANKAKPKKKSNFSKRLEEMQKKASAAQKKR
ncbi:MAG: membrane protein insertase YidC [Saprospiraceae bacterium]|nr:membrane protein insertase YidC [Saprospiraceae bacterium]